MGINNLVAEVVGAGADGGQLGRRALFRSLQGPAAAAAMLAVGFASSGALRALPAAADDIEYCDVDPIVFVAVNGIRTGVKVRLGWPLNKTMLVDQRATHDSVVASVQNGTTIVVSATVVAPGHDELSTHMRLELLAPQAVPGSWTTGAANVPMSASISA